MSEIPKGWEVKRLGDVARFINGRAYKKTEMLDHGTPILRIQNLNGGENWFYSDLELHEDKYCQKGDLLYAWSATFGPYWARWENAIYHYHIWKIEEKGGYLKSFAYYQLMHITEDLKASSRGVAMPHITKSGMEKWEVNVPPINEQKRIADKLDSVLAKVEAAQARLDKIPTILKRFRQSVLAAATSGELTKDWREESETLEVADKSWKTIVELKQALLNSKLSKKDLAVAKVDDAELPVSWNVVNLGGLASKITDGEHKTPKRSETGRYLLSARNVRDGYISLEKVDYVGDEEFEKLRKRCNPDKGDILISCSGSVGRVSLCDKDDEYVMVRSAAIVKTEGMEQNNKYLMYALQSPSLQQIIVEKSKSTAQSNLFLGPIKELPIPLPPEAEQVVIVNRVDELFEHANTVEKQYNAAKTRLDKLTQSILAKAFRGELM